MIRTIRTINRGLLAVSGAMLSVMMFLTAIDVVMRYLFKLPIQGAFELSEYMMAIIIPFSIAYCAYEKGHVSVELFFKKLPKSFQKVIGALISSLTLLFAVLITWQSVLYSMETFRNHLTSSVLLIPTYPFIIPVAIGAGGYALVIGFQLFHPGGKGGHD